MDEEYFDFLVGKAIEKGIKEGQFENLPGKGKPFQWDEWDNMFVGSEDRAANILLKNSGFAPGWVADRRDIVEQIDAARGALKRVWKWVSENGGLRDEKAGQQWHKAVEVFTRRVNEINDHIADHNLVLPNPSIALRKLDLEGEILEIQRVL